MIKATIIKNTAKGGDDLIKITGLPGGGERYVNFDVLYSIEKFCRDNGITNYRDFYVSIHVGDDVTEYLKGVYYD